MNTDKNTEEDIGCKLNIPEYKWKFSFKGSDCLVIVTNNAPNAFYRFVQRIFLGIVWERIL